MIEHFDDRKLVTDFQLVKKINKASAKKHRVFTIPQAFSPAGLSLIAVSLAACGGNDETPYSQFDLDRKDEDITSLQDDKDQLQSSNTQLTSENNDLKKIAEQYEDLTAAKIEQLTSGPDNIIGSTNNDKITGLFGTSATLTSSDLIIDTNAGDVDVLELTGTPFQTRLDTSLASIMVEEIHVFFDTLANALIDASGVTSASAFTITNQRDNSAAGLSLENLPNGAILNVSDFNSVSATGDENANITIIALQATGAISATVSGEGNSIIDAPLAQTITTIAETGDTTVEAEAATLFYAQSTSGTINLLSSANAYTRAISTFEGNITINTPLADRVLATTTGEGSVSVVAEGDSGITVAGGSIAVMLENSDETKKATIKATGTSNSTEVEDVLSIVSGDDFTVQNKSGDPIEVISINPTNEITATFEENAASTYTGNASVTLQGDHSVFNNATITGSKVVLTAMDDDTDLSKTYEPVDLNATSIQNGGGPSIILLNENAELVLSADQTNGLEINADDDLANEYLSGTLNLELAIEQSGIIVVDESGTTRDGFDRININAQVEQDTPFHLVSSSQTTVTLSGVHNFTLDDNSIAKEFDASGLSGDSLGLSGILTASQTPNLLKIYGGSGNDNISSADTSSTAVVTGGPGDDIFTFSADFSGSADGGTGADTLNISSVVDLSSATLTDFELIDLKSNNTILPANSISGETIGISSTGGAAELSFDKISSTLNLANLSFLDSNVSVMTNFETNKHGDLTSSSSVNLIGSSANDEITGHDGNDNLTGGEGSDNIVGGAGADNINLTETTSASDIVIINAVVGTSADSGRNPVSGNGNDTGDDTITAFAIGTDVVKIVASDVAGFAHGSDTTVGTAGGVDDGTAASFLATVGLVELNQSTDNVWNDVGDVAITFSAVTGTFNETNFEAALQYDLTLTDAGVSATTGDKNDTITGGSGADTITGGAGADVIDGGAGADVFLIASAADHAAGETIVGGADVDTIRFTSTTAAETLILLAGVSDADNAITVEISDAAGDNTGTTALNVNADALADTLAVTLIGNDGDNVLVGNASDDIITGGSGADTITGGAGADAIDGGAGADTISLGAADAATDLVNIVGINAVADGDTIYEFATTSDEIALTNTAGVANGTDAGALVNVAGLGGLTIDDIIADTAANLALNTAGALGGGGAEDQSAIFLSGGYAFATDTGELYYDPDGNFSVDAVLVATLFSTSIGGADTAVLAVAGDFQFGV